MPIERREELEYRHLAPMLKNRHAEPLFVKARPLEDESMPIPLSTHTGHEFDYVLSGHLKLQLGDKIEILNPGDSAFYDSSYPHGMVSVDSEGCEFLAIVMKNHRLVDSENFISLVLKHSVLAQQFRMLKLFHLHTHISTT